ncbi:MAG: hypothetical protein A2V66_00905 [Ignavibacteria bacterium RBG_13_36_8]|nr:MAG: hypothetical protein A2V66_00905 [Ignavibacteria bacterium RBG_13_36_8]
MFRKQKIGSGMFGRKLNIKADYEFLLIFFFSFLFSQSSLWAQEFSATVDKTTVGQYERFQVYFTFDGEDVNSVKNFRSPSFEGLQILSGPNQSTSMQIINGKVSSSLTYSFIVQASDIGKYSIGSASIEYKGSTYSSEPIQIEVVKGRGTPTQSQSSGGISQEELAKNVFILASADKKRAMLGEQITVTYKLYTRLNISSPQINKLPTYQGFWAEEMESSNNILFNIEMYNGERFRVATIKKVALFPSKTGTLSVTPFELTVPVLVRKKSRSNDVFDQFFNDSFFGRTETIDFVAKSNKLTIEITNLPQTNVPASFNGAIGKYDFKANINKSDVEINEGITLRLTISGQGNIQLLDVPKIQLPPGFEMYDPKTSETINRTNIISGQKTTEYLIVPRISGEKEIPSVEFTYFDLSSRRYVTSASPSFNVNIKKGEGVYETSVSGFSKEDVRLLSEDIRYIKTSNFNLQKRSDSGVFTLGFWIAAILPLFVLLGVLGVKKHHDKLHGNVRLLKYQRAEKMARTRLKSAKKALQSKDQIMFVNELSQAIFGYLEDKLGIQKAEFSLEKTLKELSARSVSEDLIGRVQSVFERCEFARFAPKSEANQISNELYKEAEDIIINLENTITEKKRK